MEGHVQRPDTGPIEDPPKNQRSRLPNRGHPHTPVVAAYRRATPVLRLEPPDNLPVGAGQRGCRPSVRPCFRGIQAPLAGMVVRGAGPNHTPDLGRSMDGTGSPAPDRLGSFPLTFEDVPALRTSCLTCRSGGRRPELFASCRHRPRHPVGRCDGHPHLRFPREHSFEPGTWRRAGPPRRSPTSRH